MVLRAYAELHLNQQLFIICIVYEFGGKRAQKLNVSA